MSAHLDSIWPGLIVVCAFVVAALSGTAVRALETRSRMKSRVWIDAPLKTDAQRAERDLDGRGSEQPRLE
jgi:hypothetical protein